MSKREWTIYALKDPRDGTLRYVGATSQLNSRYRAHVRECMKPQSRKQWLAELGNAGLKPELVTLEIVARDWGVAEKRWINQCRAEGMPLTNITAGGAGKAVPFTQAQREAQSLRLKGVKRTLETCAKIRAAFANRTPEYLAKNAAMLREMAKKPMSAETRARMSAARKRRITTPETRAKMSSAHEGRPWSKKRREAEKRQLEGVQNPAARLTPEKVRQIRKLYKRGEFGLKPLAEMFEVAQSCISKVLSGKSWAHVKGGAA